MVIPATGNHHECSSEDEDYNVRIRFEGDNHLVSFSHYRYCIVNFVQNILYLFLLLNKKMFK